MEPDRVVDSLVDSESPWFWLVDRFVVWPQASLPVLVMPFELVTVPVLDAPAEEFQLWPALLVSLVDEDMPSEADWDTPRVSERVSERDWPVVVDAPAVSVCDEPVAVVDDVPVDSPKL